MCSCSAYNNRRQKNTHNPLTRTIMGVPSIWHIITNISDGLWHHILQRIARRYYNFNRAFNHKKVREQTTETRVSIKFHSFNPRSTLAEWPQSSEPYFLSASLTKWSDETAILLKWWINEFHVKTFYGQNAAKIPGNCSQRNTTLNAISLTFRKNVHKTETDVHCTIISLSLRKTMSFNEHFFITMKMKMYEMKTHGMKTRFSLSFSRTDNAK